MVELRPGSITVTDLAGTPVEPAPLHVDWDLDAARKDGFDDYMSKEIHEQSRAVADTLLDRLLPDGTLVLDEVRITNEELGAVTKVFMVACGSSYHAGLMAKYAIEHWARLPVEIDIASEFRYRNPVIDEHTLVIGVSQSGETSDTRLAVERGPAPRGQGAGDLQRGRLVDGPGQRRRAVHTGRARDRGGRHQDPPGPDHRPGDPRPLPGPGPGHPVPGRRPRPAGGHGLAAREGGRRGRPLGRRPGRGRAVPGLAVASSSWGATSGTRWPSRAP